MISDGTLQKFKLNDKGGDRIALSERFLAEREQFSDKSPATGAIVPVFDSIPEDADNGDVYVRSGETLLHNFVLLLSSF